MGRAIKGVFYGHKIMSKQSRLGNDESRKVKDKLQVLSIADMVDRLATIDIGQKLGGCAPFFWGGEGVSWIPM